MQKGFTLVELLVVMVIVTILVTIAVPKYKGAMERGRGLEALANVASVSDAVNAYYITHDNSYGIRKALCTYSLGSEDCSSDNYGVAGITTSQHFTTPNILIGLSTVDVSSERMNLGDKNYTITFANKDGEVYERYCSGYERYCNLLGASKVRAAGGWNF